MSYRLLTSAVQKCVTFFAHILRAERIRKSGLLNGMPEAEAELPQVDDQAAGAGKSLASCLTGVVPSQTSSHHQQ